MHSSKLPKHSSTSFIPVTAKVAKSNTGLLQSKEQPNKPGSLSPLMRKNFGQANNQLLQAKCAECDSDNHHLTNGDKTPETADKASSKANVSGKQLKNSLSSLRSIHEKIKTQNNERIGECFRQFGIMMFGSIMIAIAACDAVTRGAAPSGCVGAIGAVIHFWMNFYKCVYEEQGPLTQRDQSIMNQIDKHLTILKKWEAQRR